MTSEELAQSAERILRGETCANCQYRFPLQERESRQLGQPPRKWLACSLAAAGIDDLREVAPSDSCDSWQRLEFVTPDNCRTGPPLEAP